MVQAVSLFVLPRVLITIYIYIYSELTSVRWLSQSTYVNMQMQMQKGGPRHALPNLHSFASLLL